MALFPETRWSMVLAAQNDSPTGKAALEDLCRLYWPAIYAYIRRRGNSPADAEDLTQGLFASLLERSSLAGVSREKGRLRTFLLTAAHRYMANEHASATALKRGGQQRTLSIDALRLEENGGFEPADLRTPEVEFDRQWALRLLERTFETLKADYASPERAAVFEELRGLVSFEPPPSAYEAIAARLGMSESGVKAAAHRLRGRYRQILREHIADTVASPDDVDDELRHLFAVFEEPQS